MIVVCVIITGNRNRKKDASNIRHSVLQFRSFQKNTEYNDNFKIHQRIKYLSLELSIETVAID
jgi:hypothetical protein